MPQLLAALLRNMGEPAAARISAEFTIVREARGSVPAALPRGAERAASRREKAPECTSCTGMASAAPNPGERAALHLRARVPILRAERQRSAPASVSATTLKLQIVGSSRQSGGERWSPAAADMQAEVRRGKGKGGGSPVRAGRCPRRAAVDGG